MSGTLPQPITGRRVGYAGKMKLLLGEKLRELGLPHDQSWQLNFMGCIRIAVKRHFSDEKQWLEQPHQQAWNEICEHYPEIMKHSTVLQSHILMYMRWTLSRRRSNYTGKQRRLKANETKPTSREVNLLEPKYQLEVFFWAEIQIVKALHREIVPSSRQTPVTHDPDGGGVNAPTPTTGFEAMAATESTAATALDPHPLRHVVRVTVPCNSKAKNDVEEVSAFLGAVCVPPMDQHLSLFIAAGVSNHQYLKALATLCPSISHIELMVLRKYLLSWNTRN
ncbi:hypothetical protein P691DRAFT_787960 [Macrolepiota fuliginosa MF-IS2]|uniref:Uncharacterized protein n=1 Tax=Macrolepiota fuliginosa MF-IS2 TaxID=1400762 RepID=A0A9P5X514_9AGAR|nr:hypothetical protein P691DRAFT_787960 [Macrolepiota fuliginosa MF-IS2]